MNWTEAQRYCRNSYTDLATIDNMNEMNELKKYGRVWMGLFKVRENSWQWSDQSNSSFRYWDTGEPNNYKGVENCAVIEPNVQGKWNDISCNNSFPFVCHEGE